MASSRITQTIQSTELPSDVRLMNASAAVLALLGGLAMAALLLAWVARQQVFVFKAIGIEGEVTRNSVATIRANAAPQLAGNFFTLDLQATQRVFESVPWVRHAVVRRVWPNRLVVRLEEHRAAALWSTDSGDDKLVNNFGEVFEANPGDVEDDGLPMLQGPDGSSVRLLALLQRLQPLFGRINAQIDTLSMSVRGSLHVDLDTGAEVEIGRGNDDEVVARVERFIATVPQVTAQHQRALLYADLRHNDAYAVRLKGVSTTTTAPPQRRRN